MIIDIIDAPAHEGQEEGGPEGEVLKATNPHHGAVKLDLILCGQAAIDWRTGKIHHRKGALGGGVLHDEDFWA